MRTNNLRIYLNSKNCQKFGHVAAEKRYDMTAAGPAAGRSATQNQNELVSWNTTKELSYSTKAA